MFENNNLISTSTNNNMGLWDNVGLLVEKDYTFNKYIALALSRKRPITVGCYKINEIALK